LVSPFKSKIRLEAENTALRYQLIVLRRKVRGRIRLTNGDRLVFIQLYRSFPSVLKVITVIRPETLVRWPDFVGTGVESRASLEGGRRLTRSFALDPANEHREPALGSAAYPRRTAQARI
jgi:hypothetical protein